MPIEPDDVILNKAAIIERSLRRVHEYQDLDLDVLRRIAESDWRNLVDFCREMGARIQP